MRRARIQRDNLASGSGPTRRRSVTVSAGVPPLALVLISRVALHPLKARLNGDAGTVEQDLQLSAARARPAVHSLHS